MPIKQTTTELPNWHAPTILRRKAVEQITGLSRSSIYAGIKLGTFPTPIRLTANSVGWVAQEIEAWVQARIDRRK
ncbi:helix-turn-helix transcriptional regulator [Paraburkholderia sp. ZP32-5]|uniref:helix-turn-helix transcriptional regulator n=1 Tax=Paraburkholderia sp. ZP32-5 TaxID=2883245 RepID=UPI001F37DD25|nr:AlpA family phage regulatory protein [Paraburkholderia sp. ZP32-5]